MDTRWLNLKFFAAKMGLGCKGLVFCKSNEMVRKKLEPVGLKGFTAFGIKALDNF